MEMEFITKREIKPGHYGFVEVDNVNEDGVSIWFPRNKRYQAEELREAAHVLNQIAEYLESQP